MIDTTVQQFHVQDDLVFLATAGNDLLEGVDAVIHSYFAGRFRERLPEKQMTFSPALFGGRLDGFILSSSVILRETSDRKARFLANGKRPWCRPAHASSRFQILRRGQQIDADESHLDRVLAQLFQWHVVAPLAYRLFQLARLGIRGTLTKSGE